VLVDGLLNEGIINESIKQIIVIPSREEERANERTTESFILLSGSISAAVGFKSINQSFLHC
jgi:hypothetical protein